MSSSKIKPFKIQIPDSDLEDLKRRLERTRWPNELFNAGEDYGLTVDYLKPLFDYWKDGYNWRQVEAELNRLPGSSQRSMDRISILYTLSQRNQTLPPSF